MTQHPDYIHGYIPVNGLNIYYEIHGKGKPLVLIHGGGSTIETTFGRLIPLLAKQRQVIGVELQAHGHTKDRVAKLSFEQDADDIAGLLNALNITTADFFGFSNGAHAAIEIFIRHPQLVNKLILASGIYQRDAVAKEFWEMFDNATLFTHFPSALKEAYLKINSDEAALQTMFNRDVERMKAFKGWSNAQLLSIKVPVLFVSGSKDIISIEKLTAIQRIVPNSELAVLPGIHGDYLGAIETLTGSMWKQFDAAAFLIEAFLDKE